MTEPDPLAKAVEVQRRRLSWRQVVVVLGGGAIQLYSLNAAFAAFRPASADGTVFEPVADQRAVLVVLGAAGYIVGTLIAAYAFSQFGQRGVLAQVPKVVIAGGFLVFLGMLMSARAFPVQSTARPRRRPAPPGVAELALDRALAEAVLGGPLGTVECRYSRTLRASVCTCGGTGNARLTLSVGQTTPSKLAKYRAREQKDGRRYIGTPIRAGHGWTLIGEDWEVTTKLHGVESDERQLHELQQLAVHAMAALRKT